MKTDEFLAMVQCEMPLLSKDIGRFVLIDDTDLSVSGSSSTMAMAMHMQQAVTHWELLLRAMGRALVPDKYFWYLIDQCWWA